jgi:uncharacterized protein
MSRIDMSRDECMAVLARTALGRVVLFDGALPEVLPVIYRVAGESVVVGVETSSPLAQQPEGTVVAFQADSFDVEHESGWHVRAIGVIEAPVQAGEMAVAGIVLPRPWPVGGQAAELVLRIDFDVLSGHVIELSEPTP